MVRRPWPIVPWPMMDSWSDQRRSQRFIATAPITPGAAGCPAETARLAMPASSRWQPLAGPTGGDPWSPFPPVADRPCVHAHRVTMLRPLTRVNRTRHSMHVAHVATALRSPLREHQCTIRSDGMKLGIILPIHSAGCCLHACLPASSGSYPWRRTPDPGWSSARGFVFRCVVQIRIDQGPERAIT